MERDGQMRESGAHRFTECGNGNRTGRGMLLVCLGLGFLCLAVGMFCLASVKAGQRDGFPATRGMLTEDGGRSDLQASWDGCMGRTPMEGQMRKEK